MNVPQKCPQCGATLPADAPAGLCPACLMSGAVPSQADPGATVVIEKPKPRDLPAVGETFGAYRIERELGHGGMGAVFAAEHLDSGRRVALKVLSRQLDSPEARARFLREGRLAASINHPNSVYVFGTEEIEGTPVIAMELIAGGTLQERVQRGGPLPVAEAVDAVLQIIAGLEAAQSIGILHRDIKPANCFEDTDGNVKVGDFGLSISTQGRGESHLTLPGDFLGTPAFCSPEQLRGDELNVRSDMYSVGVTLFYLLTGRTPFEGKNMVALLANALEKSPTPPSQYRPEIPQSLSRVVLRCLEKLPSSRFASYEELRRALLPFCSIAPTPATLGLRFVAMLIDALLLSVMNWTLAMLVYSDFEQMFDPTKFQDENWRWASVFMLGLPLSYWAILEGVWGASVGKAMVGLRVARLNRSAPGILRAGSRHLIVNFVSLAVVVFWDLYYGEYDVTSSATQADSFIFLVVNAAYLLALFLTARRRNGFAAVHDLLTGTRVIQKSAYQPRTVVAQAEAPVATSEAMPQMGPYHVLTELSTGGEEKVSLGYDTRLLRKVWLRQTRADEPQVPSALRNIARPGRLRWLQGERHAHGSWDAYEAVSGAPLLSLLDHRQPWESVRHWLLDIATELEASEKHDAVPAVPALDRVWITSEGRAKLMDFAAPGAPRMNAPAPSGITPRHFLNQVAISALEGRMATAEEASRRTVSAPLPLRARNFLRDLIAAPKGGSPAAELKQLVQEKSHISRWKRCAIVMALALPPLALCLALGFGIHMTRTLAKVHPELTPLMVSLITYQNMESEKGVTSSLSLSVPEARAAMELHIAGHYGHVIRDPKLWTSHMYQSAIKPDMRALAERIVAAHPQPSSEEVTAADAKLRKVLDEVEKGTKIGQRFGDNRRELVGVMGLLSSWLMFVVAIASLGCVLVFRRGPLFRLLGIAAVTADGAEASRLRMLCRGLIAWSPVLLGAMMIGMSIQGNPARLAVPSVSFALLTLAIAIVSLIPRERSLQDHLAGTWLVPK